MSEAEIYFIVSNGIALSGMPAFGARPRFGRDLEDGSLAAPSPTFNAHRA
jgi:hypothetical protein